MSPTLFEQVVSQALGTAFALLQAVLVASLFAVVKTVVDSRQHKRDINAAFTAIRALQNEVTALKSAAADAERRAPG